ncbi:unnamed protein product [Discula destructiva]
MAIQISRFSISLSLRLFAPFLLRLLLGGGPAAAQEQSTLPSLSTCSFACLVQGLARSGCAPTDFGCQCRSKVMGDAVTMCVLGNCTMQDGLDVSRSTATICNLSHESATTSVVVVMSVLFGATVLFVTLRVTSKLLTRTLCIEDYIIIAALLLTVVPAGALLQMANLGFGRHIWDLKDGALTKVLQLVYISEIFYVAALALTKVSLVCMYIRIFRTYPPFKLACYGALAFIILPSTVIILVTILSCQPVPYFWNRDIPNGKCVDVAALAYANSAFAVAQDALLIVLPIGMLYTLNMSLRKKALIGLMFAVGGLGLVATIIRLRTLNVFGDLADPSWDYVPVVYWTTIEQAAGIIASCMPAVRKLAERIFGPMWRFGSTLRGGPSDNSEQQEIRLKRQQGGWPAARVQDPLDSVTWKDESWGGSSQGALASSHGAKISTSSNILVETKASV